MLFLIGIPILLTAFLIYQYIFVTRVYYIGQSLHKLRELRCEVVLSLSANVTKELSKKEVTEQLQFLLKLNAIIEHFDVLKPAFVQFKSLRTIYSNILFSAEKSASPSNNSTIPNQYNRKLKEGILTAFKAIPFIRLRSFVFFFRILATLSIKLGFSRYKQHLKIIEKISQFEKDNGIPCNP